MARTPFRIRVHTADGDTANYDVIAVEINSYEGEALEFTTDSGQLVIQAPNETEENQT